VFFLPSRSSPCGVWRKKSSSLRCGIFIPQNLDGRNTPMAFAFENKKRMVSLYSKQDAKH
jgi:hypothetical protein